MIYTFGQKSLDKLSTCDTRLIAAAKQAIEVTPIDFTIVWGFRGEEQQNSLFESGASKKPWPESEHNVMYGSEPFSMALDFAPWIDGAIPWKDTHAFAVVAGVFLAAANLSGSILRWGGDWDMDGSTTDQTFMDWGHLELRV